MAVYTAKLLALHHMLDLKCCKEKMRLNTWLSGKVLTFPGAESSILYWAHSELHYHDFLVLFSYQTHQKERSISILLFWGNSKQLLHHLHVNGNFVGVNSQFTWNWLFYFKETSCECWKEISSMQKVRVHVRAICHSWVSDISMLPCSLCMWYTACWTGFAWSLFIIYYWPPSGRQISHVRTLQLSWAEE